MLYTDGVHLISDTGIEHLHQYAKSVGIDLGAFDISGIIARHPHYKVYGNAKRRVLADAQVIKTTPRQIVKLLQLNYNMPRTPEEVAEWEEKYGKYEVADSPVISTRVVKKVLAWLKTYNGHY